jgi:hypothetical protein
MPKKIYSYRTSEDSSFDSNRVINLHDKQDDGESVMPQESPGTVRHREKSHVHLFMGL